MTGSNLQEIYKIRGLNMKKLKYILSICIAVILTVSIIGCSSINKRTSEIISDLEVAGFKETVDKTFATLSELTGNYDYDMSCKIINNAEFKTTNIYECNINCSNSDFEVSYDLKVTYIKNNGWQFSGYEIANISTKTNLEISNDRIIGDIQSHFAQYNKTVEIDESSISKEADESGIGYEVSASGIVTEGILSKDCSIRVSYIYTDEWNVYVNYTMSSYDWNIQALAGKKWLDTHKSKSGDFIYIESVDETNSTMMVGYRKGLFSSTIDGPYEEHGKPISCSYTYDEECLKIATGDFTLKIYPDMNTLMSGYKTYPSN